MLPIKALILWILRLISEVGNSVFVGVLTTLTFAIDVNLGAMVGSDSHITGA